MSGEILFLAHRIPFPPDRGDKIRSCHILKCLSELAPVHVATFADSEKDWDHEGDLERVATSHYLADRRKNVVLAGLEALALGKPVSLQAFEDKAMATYVDKVCAERPISTIYVFSGQMGQYVPADFQGRIVMDLVDVDSAKFEAYAKTSLWPMKAVNAREGRALKREEERLAHSADITLLVSDAEAKLFASRLEDPRGVRVSALPNGIDTTIFNPANVTPEPFLARQKGPHIVFSGQMDYPPNVAAALRIVHRIMPAVWRTFPAAMCHIVGRAPTQEVLACGKRDGVRVWGEVPDVKPFLAGADIVLAPLDIARGIQNKVLEAMAMARPVVLTPEAATGIPAEDGQHFCIEDNDTALFARIVALLTNRGRAETMGQAARKFVVENMGWEAALAKLPSYVGFACDNDGQFHAA